MGPLKLGSLLLVCFACFPSFAATQAPSASPAPATSTVEYRLPADKLAKSKALYDLDLRMLVFGTVYSLLVLLCILYLGIAARYRNWAEKISRRSFVQAMLFVPLLFLTIDLLELPLRAYRHSVSLEYGLSVQRWASWLVDVGKGELITLLLLVVVVWVVRTLVKSSPGRWWLYCWMLAVPFVVFLIFVAPLVFDPLFNKFEPLEKQNAPLVEAIERVTQRGGLTIPRDRMFLMKASEKVTTLNAYVTGFGPSKRVVVWDTTIQKATLPETLFVYGHEMGHYVLDHIVIGIIATSLGLLVGFYFLYRIALWMFPRQRDRWQMRELWDWAAFPMLLLIFSVLTLLSQPIGSTISRQLEHNADVYGLEVTHGINPAPQEAAAHAFQVLGELSLDYPDPSPFLVFWYYDHPPIADRVRFTHQYDPWSKGQPRKYLQ